MPPKRKESRDARMDPFLAGAAEMVMAAAEAAKTATRAAQAQSDAASCLVSTVEALTTLQTANCATIAGLIADKLALATDFAAEKQRTQDQGQWELLAEEKRQEGQLARERQKELWSTLRQLGIKAMTSAEPAQLPAPQAQLDLQQAAMELLSKLSPATQEAIVADCGEEQVQRFIALVVNGTQSANAEKKDEE